MGWRRNVGYFLSAIRYPNILAVTTKFTIYTSTMLHNLQILPFYQPANLHIYEPTSLEPINITAWWPTRGKQMTAGAFSGGRFCLYKLKEEERSLKREVRRIARDSRVGDFFEGSKTEYANVGFPQFITTDA